MTRRTANLLVLLAFLALAGTAHASDDGCRPEPASQWAPAGFVCPPIYGSGTASTWPGPGVARNDCVYPWTACPPIVVTSVDTGRSVTVTPSMWCMCWVGFTGPQGETARLVDLDPVTLAALGLEGQGLYPVWVDPAFVPTPAPVLPDTAVAP